jgi:hypothetical protein
MATVVTVTVTGKDVVEAPWLSVATAVSTWVPGYRTTAMEWGLAVSLPTELPSTKNSTLATVPSVSLATALIVTLAGDTRESPLAGLVMETEGGTFAAAFTVTLPTIIVKCGVQ